MPKRSVSKKDSQRRRVYDAEQKFLRPLHSKSIGDIYDCQQFVNRVLARSYVQKHYPTPNIVVKGVPQKTTKAHAVHSWLRDPAIEVGTGTLAAWSRTDAVLLHEIAHILSYERYGVMGHGWQFAATFLDLVRNVMGKPAHDALKKGYKAERVRFRAPRTRAPRVLSPEQKAAQTERLRMAREKREAKLAPKREMKERAIKLHHKRKIRGKRTPQGHPCYDHYLGNPSGDRAIWIEKDPRYLSYKEIQLRLSEYDAQFRTPVPTTQVKNAWVYDEMMKMSLTQADKHSIITTIT